MHDEIHLISACQAGDTAAFETLVRRYQERTIRLLCLLLGNHDDAQDVAQETFIRAYRSISAFRGTAAFNTWLHRIAVNTARNWIRKNKRELTILPDYDSESNEGHTRTEDLVLAREHMRDIQRALDSLPNHYRETLILRHYSDFSYEEIADIQGVPVGTVRSRLAKGRKLLQGLLEERECDTVAERTITHELQKG